MKDATGVFLAAAFLLLAGSAQAQVTPKKVDLGKLEFEANCASCHGANGKGNGPITDLLKKSPPDLTLLSQKNGGVLPVARLYEVIDGAAIPGHGSREMPIWGREYKTAAAEYYMDHPYDPEVFVRGKILALIDYINRLQAR